jgi:hypothetical protein
MVLFGDINMKIKIEDLEKKLNKKLKRNFTSVGVDTAQVSGIVFLKTDKEYVHIDSLVLSFKTKDSHEIYSSMINTFEKIFKDEDFAVIEEVFVGFSRAGSVELAKYGAFAISACIRKDIKFETISATSARSKFQIDVKKYGKGKSKQAVADWVKNLDIVLGDNNIVDGFILALLGLIENQDFRSQKDIKEDKKK